MPFWWFVTQDEAEDEGGHDWRGEIYEEADEAQQRELEGSPYAGNFGVTIYPDGTYEVGEPRLFPDAVQAPDDENRLRGWLGIG